MSVETVSPISYDPFDVEIDRTVHDTWRRMREEQPVYWNERFGFFALSRFQDVWDAYHDTATFSSSHGVQLETLDAPTSFPSVIFMDPPEHDVMRKLVSRAFTPRRINDLRSHIEELVARYLDPLVGSSGFDYIEQFGALLPPMVIGHMLGIPESERDMVRRWFDEMLHREEGQTEPSNPTSANAGLQVHGYATQLINERRQRPGEDMVSTLVTAEIEENGVSRRLTDHEVALFVVLLAGAGVETVARLLSWTAVTLARNPRQRQLLVDDPSLIPGAIEEVLRYEAPSPVNGRWTLRDFSAHGVDIPAGSKVLLLNGSANRDPREFTDPDTFDVRRAIGRHITFGFGAHFCLGAALARMEGQVALAGTLARFPHWEIDEERLVAVQTSTVRGYSSVPIHLDARSGA
ncbi:Cytochrome P450 [Parafrankia irregularis]|uniref:Cytochrome P450 n=1 Tax=Parafrankia irregularis TaxID=795642 RepID=A0A0S4QXM4_9ACTN|nr:MULTISPECIES: cytochrome P450 [Parafrankia]MBE3199968.1 cytochrome P450 [Parafrankia sp. CH37]CUU59286.1 Cytochrome P450 [Parafrankia irregularis]